MKTLYVQNPDPFAILMKELWACRSSWLGNNPDIFSKSIFPAGDSKLFELFSQNFGMIAIYSGHPHGDYGQTIHLYSPGQFTEPDVHNLPVTGNVPSYRVGENLLFKPSRMTGAYRYNITTDNRIPDMPRVQEEFFFEYQPGYKPLCFSDVHSSLGVLRDLSAILHNLDIFNIVLMERGIYVELNARIDNNRKPKFHMGS